MSLGFLGRWMPAPLIGVDISASALKLVELRQDRKGTWILERFASESLQPGCVVEGNIENFEATAESLKRLLVKSGTSAKNVALALPHASVITKKVALPVQLSEQELEVQVEAEASQYLPFPLDQVSLDFCTIGPNTQNPKDVDVLLVATRKEKVEERNDLAILAGLKPVVMDVESYASSLAASRWMATLPNVQGGGLIALIKLGARSFSLQIVRNDEILYDIEQSASGAQLSQMMASQYGISVEEAERSKRNGKQLENYEELVLRPFIASLSQDVGRALQFFYSSTSYRSIQHIAIFGGTACIDGLAQAIEDQVKVPVTVINPFDGMKLAAALDVRQLQREAPMYLTACGLAMRRYLS